jgi:futalosine hydrolase
MDILIIVATELEAKRLPALPDARVAVSGIGAVNAALETQAQILRAKPDLVLSVGIAGAYANSGLVETDVIVSSGVVYAGLGAQAGSSIDLLNFAVIREFSSQLPVWDGALMFAQKANLLTGVIATLETVTTDPARALGIETQFSARAEAMEGAGVVHAALRHGVPAFELRAISNMVGPRNPLTWKIKESLAALGEALEENWNALGQAVLQ